MNVWRSQHSLSTFVHSALYFSLTSCGKIKWEKNLTLVRKVIKIEHKPPSSGCLWDSSGACIKVYVERREGTQSLCVCLSLCVSLCVFVLPLCVCLSVVCLFLVSV